MGEVLNQQGANGETKPGTGSDTALVVPQPPGSPPVVPATSPEETPQQEFERLVERKVQLDLKICDKPREIRELTAEQKEIDDIDARLMVLWKSGRVTRKEG